jgi:uncharacterized protein YjbI with pentapeptide repeats
VVKIYKDKRALAVFLFLVMLGSFLYYFSYSAIKGIRPPLFLSNIDYSPVANLENENVSIKPPNWTNEITFVKEARLSGRNLRYARAYNAFLVKADLSAADLYRANLVEADLRGANLEYAKLNQVKLLKANLEGASLKFANLSRALLNGASLKGATLLGAILKEVSLDNADLTEANLFGANLKSAYLQDACLKEADLESANLQKAKLTGADLENAKLENADLMGANLFQAKGLSLTEVKTAKNWKLAFYDSKLRKKLMLPADHNEKVRIELKEINKGSKKEG